MALIRCGGDASSPILPSNGYALMAWKDGGGYHEDHGTYIDGTSFLATYSNTRFSGSCLVNTKGKTSMVVDRTGVTCDAFAYGVKADGTIEDIPVAQNATVTLTITDYDYVNIEFASGASFGSVSLIVS